MIVGYKLVFRTKGVKAHEADLFSGKAVIDADEQEWLAKEAEKRESRKQQGWLYAHSVGYLF
jgi:yeast amino acid transporter